MPAMSVRASLQKIGEPKPGKVIPPFPGGFHSAPRSLRAALHAMLPPGIESWANTHQSTFENLTWTEECQGLTTDGRNWYVSSNNKNFRAIHKFTLDFKQSLGAVQLPPGSGTHIGDIDYYTGRIYVPISTPAPKVWEVDQNLNTLRLTALDDNPKPGLGWCAINPWNGYLYTCPGDGADRIHAFDPGSNFAYKGFLLLEGPPVNGLQGGCFSANGHFYLTSDKFVNENATKEIRAYSALNGSFLGSCSVSYDESDLEAEEMEGLAIAHLVHNGGDSTYVHVVILDNDATNEDDVFLRHFSIPDPSVL
jgi:hypothetical protein